MKTTKKPKTTTTAFNYDTYHYQENEENGRDYYIYPENYELFNDDYLTDNFHENVRLYGQIIDILKIIYAVASVISLIVNIPHLFILTRKELRSNLIYIVMAGICICDLLHAIGKITALLVNFIDLKDWENCPQGKAYHKVVIDIICTTFQIIGRRWSGCLALFIAGFRSFSVIFPMSNAVNFMMKPKAAWSIVLVFGLLCSGSGATYFFMTEMELVKSCPGGILPNYEIYIYNFRQKWEFIYRMIDGCISIFISVSYAIVAITLIIALYLANIRRKNLKSETNNKTSMMVGFMAGTLFLSEATHGLIFMLNLLVFKDYQEQSSFEQLSNFALTLMIINSIAHCFICFFMSSQYRDTVKRVIGRGKEKENNDVKVEVVESSAHPTTVQTAKTSNNSNRTI